jgi:transcriptional regulator with XRE-family HTH domain
MHIDSGQTVEAMGPKIRRQRRRLGLTLDELAGRAGLSKPYLSLIETGRVPNPPSDQKLQRLEQSLGFPAGELLTQAHVQRTPRDVRALLEKLLHQKAAASQAVGNSGGVMLEDAFLTGMLQELARMPAMPRERSGAPATRAVPVINRVSAGYPRDFADLSYPPRVAEEFVSCPDVEDRDAFAARVQGDSMMPRYGDGDIVIFSPALPRRSGDDCFVCFSDGQTTFDRVFFEPADGGAPMVQLQPRNEKYRAQTVASERIAAMYRAVYRYAKVE